MKRIRNMTGGVLSLCGMDLAPYGFYDIESFHEQRWASSLPVLQALLAGAAMMNDGQNDFGDPVQGLNFLRDIEPRDSEGAMIYSPKTNSAGWTYQKVAFDYLTCVPDSLAFINCDGSLDPTAVVRCFDSANTLLLTQEERDISCVKTIIDWMPTSDFEIVGGEFRVLGDCADTRLWIMAVPDYPYAYGGQRVLAKNIACRFDYLFKCDGRNRKKLSYNGGAGTNKVRVIVRHTAGLRLDSQLTLEVFFP